MPSTRRRNGLPAVPAATGIAHRGFYSWINGLNVRFWLKAVMSGCSFDSPLSRLKRTLFSPTEVSGSCRNWVSYPATTPYLSGVANEMTANDPKRTLDRPNWCKVQGGAPARACWGAGTIFVSRPRPRLERADFSISPAPRAGASAGALLAMIVRSDRL